MYNYKFRKNKSYVERKIEDVIFLVRIISKKKKPDMIVLEDKSHVAMWQLLSKHKYLNGLSEAAMNYFDFKDLNEAKQSTHQFIKDLIKKDVIIKV